ncbi:hypothetical protein ACGFNU_21435 [Spirillospora sp. NPDC048911]|uniref:hypothetical protein n=1 Tax=Spirillospora sp. NPDC048911 TaxID=3364527 RepID=UPI003719C133
MADDLPDWAKQLQDALEQAGRELGDAFTKAGHILGAQAAMGWAFQGEFDHARTEIAKLPRPQIEILSMAARALATLAEEEAVRR